MDRKLASIQLIGNLEPIPGADAIEKATILGWSLVVKKGDFKVGGPCVYCEIDSILPEHPAFEFLRPRHFRIKTIKLRGQVSQGIAFPLSVLPLHLFEQMKQAQPSDLAGVDVTEALGVVKYEPYIPAELAGIIKGNFPAYLQKTDEIRIQAVPGVLERHKQKKFYVTEKLDGSSMTVYLYNGEFGVCSRNLDMKETETNAFWKTARTLDLETRMRGVSFDGVNPVNLSIQGELIGNGVQKNKYNLPGLDFRLFNVFNIDKQEYLSFPDFLKVVDTMGLNTVPVLNYDYILPNTVDELVEFSKGKSVLNDKSHREGIVLRPVVEERDEELGRLSFKAINPDFLLKYDE